MMKKSYLFAGFTLLAAIGAIYITPSYLTANSNGAMDNVSGSPADGSSCASSPYCHGSAEVSEAFNWITSDIPEEGYVPGKTYTITLQSDGTSHSSEFHGFECASESSGSTKVGTFQTTDNRVQILPSGNITHTEVGTVAEGTTNTWSVLWTAPAENTGSVTFYGAFILADDSGTPTGDQMYTSTLEVSEQIISSSHSPTLDLKVYPNPASDFLFIQGAIPESVSIYSLAGQKVFEQNENFSSSETNKIKITDLSKGSYIVHVKIDGQTSVKKIQVR